MMFFTKTKKIFNWGSLVAVDFTGLPDFNILRCVLKKLNKKPKNSKMKHHLLLVSMLLLISWTTMGQPTIENLELTPSLDITYFSNYVLSVNVDPNGATINNVSFIVRPQQASDSNSNWDFLTNGTPPYPNESLVKTATNTTSNTWSFSQLRPDNIYPEIAFIYDINSAPSDSRFWQDSYELMHFTNNFEITAKTNFFIEVNATPNSGSPPSVDMQVYLVGRGFDISAFRTGELANEAWQNHSSVELVGTISRDEQAHHTHSDYSRHFLVPLSADADGKIGNKNLDISDDFWIILTTGHQLQTRGWDMKHHAGDNNGTWYKGSGTTFTLQNGRPDVHVHFAREDADSDVDAMEVKVKVEYNSEESVESISSFFYFAELPNLPPNASAFTAPEAGSYSGNVTISWQPATDPNNDNLTYKVYLIDINGNATSVATGITGTSYVLNTNSNDYSNGEYDILVEACDTEFCTGFTWSSSQDEGAKITFSTDWVGGSSGDSWATAANWSSGTVPDEDSWVRIPAVTNGPIIGSGTTAVCNNLVIESGGELTIESGGELTIEERLDNSGTVTVNSNASASGSLILNGTLNGNVTYNRYLVNDRWHLVSSPVAGQTFNSTFFADNSIDHNPTSTEFALIDYDTENNQWNPYPDQNATGIFTSGKGFLMARYEESSVGGTVNFTGTVATSAVSFTPSTLGYRWNAVGNPFPSAIGINSNAGTDNFINLNSSSLDPSFVAIYYWDDTDGGTGNYIPINQSSPAFYAAPGQGFFVKAATGATAINFPLSIRTHNGLATLNSGQAEWPQLEIIANSGDARSVASIKFVEGTTPGLDVGYDAGKFKSNPEINLFTKLVDDNGVDFGLQCLPPTQMESLAIPLGLDVKSAGEITFSINYSTLPGNLIPVLEDRLLNINTPFETDSNTYTSTVNESESDYGRFYISFSSTTDVAQIQNGNFFRAWYSNNTIQIQGNVEGAAIITLYDINGRALMHKQVAAASHHSLSIPNIGNGIYLVKIACSNRTELLKVPVLK